jgi:hypothetical protein
VAGTTRTRRQAEAAPGHQSSSTPEQQRLPLLAAEAIGSSPMSERPRESGVNDYLDHESPAGHYRISYPPDWMHLSVSTTDAFFFSRLQGPDDDFSDHISVRAEHLDQPDITDLEAIAEAALASLKRSEPSFALDGKRTDEVAGRPAIRLALSSSGRQGFRYDTVIVVDGTLAYHLTYTAEADNFDAFAEVFQTMLDSFSLKDPLSGAG